MPKVLFEDSLAFARELDNKDNLKRFRKEFFIPRKNGKEVIYLCGNSLGLQSRSIGGMIEQELEDWKKYAVEGHFKAKNPWFYYHHFFSKQLSKMVGAKPGEVVAMNTLTTNLHLMMVSFYRPNRKRYKIMIEGSVFPSDYYAVESQVEFHGFDPKKSIIELMPRRSEQILRTEDILSAIETHKNELALILIGAVNYYTGQYFDLEKITRKGHEAGAMVGFDLAHAIGNVPMKVHEWGVDFAAWCTYKYLNSGPGAPGGIFVHERHGDNVKLPRFAGWWGYDEETRFLMRKGFKPIKGAGGWQLSNAQVLSMAAHKGALDIFDKAGMKNLRKKSELLTGYLEFLIEEINEKTADRRPKTEDGGQQIKIITPKNPKERGCQLSLVIRKFGKKIFEKLTKAGVIADWREPDVIRVAPVPLYNTFEEVYRFVEILKSLI